MQVEERSVTVAARRTLTRTTGRLKASGRSVAFQFPDERQPRR